MWVSGHDQNYEYVGRFKKFTGGGRKDVAETLWIRGVEKEYALQE